VVDLAQEDAFTNRIRITQTIRACVIVPPALCFAFQQTTDGTPAASQTGPEAADLILHHGFVWTVDESKPQAEAVAARGDRIIKVDGNRRSVGSEGRTQATDRSEGRVRHARLQRQSRPFRRRGDLKVKTLSTIVGGRIVYRR
jgi:hypothetical protein